MAQTMSWDATLVAVVVGLLVFGAEVLGLEVSGSKESVILRDEVRPEIIEDIVCD